MMKSKMAAPNPKDNVYPNGNTGENIVTEFLGKTWAGFDHVAAPSELQNADATFMPNDGQP